MRFGKYISANYPLIFNALFDTGRVKVFFANAQIIGSIAWSTGVSWPKPFSYTSKVMSIFEINLFDIIPFSCLGPGYNFYGSVIASTLIPVLINGSLLLLMAYEMKKHQGRVIPQEQKGICARYIGDENFVWFIILMIFYMFLPTGNLALVRVFKCIEFPDGSQWLEADLSIQCNFKNGDFTQGHIAMIVYASLMLLIYGPGIPLLFRTLLRQQHDEIINYDKEQDHMECPKALQPLKFLFFHYKPENYNAEYKECFRRLALMGLVALIPSIKSDS